jgi:hypothetical protein
MNVLSSSEITDMASIPDGETVSHGSVPGSGFHLDYNDATGHQTDDDNETDEDDRMEVVAAEGEETDVTTPDGCRHSSSGNTKEGSHGSTDSSMSHRQYTASEKAKKFIAENRSGCGGGGRTRAAPLPEKTTLRFLLRLPLTGTATYGTGLVVAGTIRTKVA